MRNKEDLNERTVKLEELEKRLEESREGSESSKLISNLEYKRVR